MTYLLLIGVWCFVGAVVAAYLLVKVDRWTESYVRREVNQALAKDRHPARVAPRLTPAAPTRACPICHAPVPFGPIAEHYCRGGVR